MVQGTGNKGDLGEQVQSLITVRGQDIYTYLPEAKPACAVKEPVLTPSYSEGLVHTTELDFAKTSGHTGYRYR